MMEVRPGYKNTEVGVIPADWEVKRLGEVATIATGNTPPTSDASNYGVDFLFVSPVDMGDTKFISKTEKMLSEKGFGLSRRFPKNSILFVCIGSTIGKCGIAPVELTSNQQINAIFPSESFSVDFLFYAVSAAAPQIKAQAGEQAVPIVNKTQFSETTVTFPPLPEQRAIAAALSDVDALLDGLERLIAKKRDLKQAAMQQLLTGQTRLPGKWHVKTGYKKTEVGEIPEDWEVKTLYSVLRKGRLGGNYANQDEEAGFPLMKMGNIARGYFDVSKIEYIAPGITPESTHSLAYGDVLFNTRNTLDLVGKVAIWRNELPVAFYNSNLMRLEFDPLQVCSNEYANYALNTASAVARLRGLATGTTSVAAIYTRDLLKFLFVVPPLDEQTAIATILSDMDAELAALQARRDKTRALKHGMMQELLSGKTRLIFGYQKNEK